MSSHNVEFIPKKTKRNADLCKVLLLQAGDVLYGCPCIVGIDCLELRKTFTVVREAQGHDRDAHHVRIKLDEVTKAALQICAIVDAGHEYYLRMQLNAAFDQSTHIPQQIVWRSVLQQKLPQPRLCRVNGDIEG